MPDVSPPCLFSTSRSSQELHRPCPTPFISYDPDQGHGLKHDPFKAIIAPRVIGWISSLDAQGRVNLAPYSFFGAFASSFPYVIGFSSEGRKDSIANIEATGEFV